MMKKVFLPMLFLLTIFCAMPTQAGVVDRLCLYLPNRILDMVDMFYLDIGVGPVARAELRFTRAFQFGAGIGCTAGIYKDANRQYGAALQNGWDTAFTCITSEDIERRPATELVHEFWHDYAGFPQPSQRIYDFHEGARDYWEIGGTLGAVLVEVNVALAPVEIADFISGWFFIDIKGDDLTFESFE